MQSKTGVKCGYLRFRMFNKISRFCDYINLISKSLFTLTILKKLYKYSVFVRKILFKFSGVFFQIKTVYILSANHALAVLL